ncbi:MAG: hypothetical protein LLF94_10305 [Chlamydiales bacterium]|nr:hypothetical protein [Chlamydiales bacterium]
MDYSSKIVLHASCEKLLAVSAQAVLPTLIPLKGRTFDWGFEYDFISEGSCDEGILPLINEQMRRFVHEDIPFEALSMVPQNASSFLQKKQPIQAEFCLDYPSNVVPLCKLRNFYDICPEELLASTREIRSFALYEMFFLPDSIVRIRGVAFDDKKELKTYLKQIDRAKNNDPIRLGRELDLFSFCDEEVVWHPKGVACKKLLENKLQLAQRGYKEIFSSNPEMAVKALYEVYNSKKKNHNLRFWQNVVRESEESDGLFQVHHASSTVQYTHCTHAKLQEELISSLQFMKQIASILNMQSYFLLMQRGKEENSTLVSALTTGGYPYEVRRSDANQIELHVFDQRGRTWPLSKLTLKDEVVPLIECVPVLSYERIMALMLEKEEGFLPFWLSPLQIRLLPVEQEAVKWSENFAKTLTQQGFRVDVDMRSTPLGERMYQASLQKVACAVVIGKQELEKQELQVKFLPRCAESFAMTVTQFIEKIRMEENPTLESESRDSSS